MSQQQLLLLLAVMDNTQSLQTSTAWALEETEGKWKSRANLFSAGFDRVGFGWSIRDQKDGKSEHTTKGEKSSKDATF